MDDGTYYKFTEKGLRNMIAAYEYALEYEHLDTSEMSEKQLFKLFVSMRNKADVNNFPNRYERCGEYLKRLLDIDEIARGN